MERKDTDKKEKRKRRSLPKTFSHEEFLKIIKYEDKKEFKLAYILGFYQVMRISEVTKLNPEDIDQSRGYIHILSGKGAKDRDIPLMKPTEMALRWGKKHLPIKYSIRTLQRAFKKAGKEVLGKDLNFHMLRHSGATSYLNGDITGKKVDIRHMQFLLGHSQLSTTEIYTHVTPSAVKKIFDEVYE